jgi:VTC domain-containing protein
MLTAAVVPGAPDLLGHAAGFAAVSLQELEDRAGLQMRVDRRYIVDYETLERLFSELGEDDYLALEIDGERLQQYDSLYFDTPELLTYKHHLQGRRKRFKCRTRLYGGTSCFFDLKMKGRRGETVKSRLPLSAPEHGSLTSQSTAFLKRGLLKEYAQAAPAGMVPTLQTSFDRLTLIHPHQPERLTIDFGITFSRTGSSERYRMRPGHVLIETKSAATFGTVDRLLPGLGARPLSMCSKYCLGIAAARPGLPTNPYRSLLRRHFDPTPLPPLAAGRRDAA